jgi:peptidoglycan hydrolase-like protein with peptidoglycan-binding domain
VARITQTVTSIIAPGGTVSLGDVLYTIDSVPVVALFGSVPEWRSLSSTSAAGVDISELQQSLIDLGYDSGKTVTVNGIFDAATVAMVKRWQAGLGQSATGKVALGSVVFIPKAMAVQAVSHVVGDLVGDGDAMVTLAGSTQQVIMDVPSGDEQYFAPGLVVQLSPGGTGKVAVLQSVSRNGSAVVEAVIAPDAPIEGVDNGGSVSVSVDIKVADSVFVVPARALVSRLDGSYAVEVQGTGGASTWYPVKLVAVAGSNVGITGDGLADGMQVLAPAA